MRHSPWQGLRAPVAAVLAFALLAAACGDGEDDSGPQEETPAVDSGDTDETAPEPTAEPDAGSQDESLEDAGSTALEDGAAGSAGAGRQRRDDTPGARRNAD